MTPGYYALQEWSLSIHGKEGDRHEWVLAVAKMFDEGYDWMRDTDEFPPFPSPFKITRISRLETAARIYANAPELPERTQRGLFG